MSRGHDNTTNGESTNFTSSLSSPRGATTRSVSFSSEVSVFTENATDNNAVTKELADAGTKKGVAPSPPQSLFSGRWIESVQEGNESDSVAIVEVTDHSPSTSQSCKEWKQKRYNGSSVIKDRLSRMQKRLLERHEEPLQDDGNHDIPDLTSSEETVPSLAPRNVNGNESMDDLPTSTSPPPATNGKSLGRPFDLRLPNMGDIGHSDEKKAHSEYE